MLQNRSKWKYVEVEDNAVASMDEFTDLSPVLKKMLVQRGITSEDEVNRFLSPDLNNLHSAEWFDSIGKASERIHDAIHNKEKILVFGDYDADGVSSTTVMLKTLQELGADCEFYIPNRFTEGYGPNEDAFVKAHEEGFSVIITVDTGIAAVYEAFVAKELGIDLIITDHHEIQEELPEAFAIIHPKCSPNYPFKELAGVGVAFKFAESLLGYFPKHLLEFVAIGTIADLVPLVDENRIFAYFGLHALTISKNVGIQALKSVSNIEGNVTEEDVGFSIGPRLNAVGRLQDADLAVQLLMSDNLVEAMEIAREIQGLNEKRQKIVNEIVKEAEEIIQDINGVIVVAKEGWNEGVLGIVASKLVRKYDRPAIVLTIKPELQAAKGSARSIPAFDLFTHCMKVRELFTHFGGHAQAAGMTIPLGNIELISERLNSFILEELTEEDFKQEIEISSTLDISGISVDLIYEIGRLAPFGMKNPKPVFEIKDIPTDVRQIGSARNHLKLQFNKDSSQIESIGFGLGHLYHSISPNTPISVVGDLGINEWNGNKKAQIMIQDMKIDSWQLFDQRGRRQIQIQPISDQRILAVSNGQLNVDASIYHKMYQEMMNLEEIDMLYICDLPPNLEILKRVVNATKPKIIYACYSVEESAYLTSFPKREEFIWYYALIKKRKMVDLKRELKAIMNVKGWNKERIIFMSKVFFELDFVKIENGIVKVNPNPEKRDLTDSASYKDRLKRIEVEKTLYYSNYEELKTWFTNCREQSETTKEEVVNGL
ncbi:single-stranded-DNA-specific exonuclease RecJ [Oceanobacillus sp. Castelsardo]|uniref:single-stranded-DNA-specific exonuclease RecJ n=1 Tax=Oceanobacillus sp. Castelsardo TaxID=1851204 RepID=UPI000839964B|nr:single-stranded-DNA-specific exonuclease RecJ [Oceanobacillus sp. Castelsardo]